MIAAHALFLLWVLACWSAGLRVWALLRIDTASVSPWLRHISCANVGVGVSILGTLALGLLNALQPVVLVSLLILMLASGMPLVRQEVREITQFVSGEGHNLRVPKHVVALVCLSVATWIFGWVLSFVPPVFFDTLVYHLGLPQQYVIRGGMHWSPSMFSALPANAEMLYTLGLGVGDGLGPRAGEILARLFSWALGVSCALTAGAWCNDRRPGSGWFAVALVAAMPMVLSLGAHNLSDHAAALFLLQAVALALRWRETEEKGLLWAAALFAGLVMGTKYTGLYTVAPGVLVLLFAKPRKSEWPSHAKVVVASGLLALAIASPWYIRNVVHTGNPVYPAFYSVLGGEGWSEESAQKVAGDSKRGAGSGLTLERVVRLPWEIIFEPPKYGAFSDVGRAYLLILLAAALALATSRTGRGIALFAVLVLPFWLGTAFNLRYILPLFALTQCGAAVGLNRLARRGLMPTGIVTLVIGVLAAANVWNVWTVERDIFGAKDYLVGITQRDAFITRSASYYPAAQFINKEAPPEGTVLLIGDTRPYYVERPVLTSSAYDTAVIVQLTKEARSVDDLECALVREGVTLIAYNAREVKRLEESYNYFSWEPHHQALFDGLRTRLRPLKRAGPVSIYALAEMPGQCSVAP